MRNPVFEEARQVMVHRREYLLFHVIYLAVSAAFVMLLWPTRGYVHFFRTESVPAVFEATVIFQVIVLSVLSVYAGMDRFAQSATIRFTEWLEHTNLPVGTLIVGKLVVALVHSVFLATLAVPFVVIGAGPSGMPMSVVVSSLALLFLTALTCRIAGMLISYIGENRYVIRVIGSWMFLALLYVATVQILPVLNPIVALVRQQAASSVLLETGTRVPLAEHPMFLPAVSMTGLMVFVAGTFALQLFRHRKKNKERLAHG